MIATIKRRSSRKSRPKRPASNRSAEAFEAMLPQIQRYAGASFKQLPPAVREEAVQDAVTHALLTYRRLVELGKSNIAYPGALARCGVLRVKEGRKEGHRQNAQDVLNEHSQRRKNTVVERLDRYDEPNGCWRQIAVEDRHAGPAEVACLRIDFGNWLDQQPKRDRQVAESLAIGYTPGEVARRFSLSQARISQLRRLLHESWNTFQGEEPSAAIAAEARKAPGRRRPGDDAR